MEHPEPWFVCWRCACCDAQPTRADLPERCPGHGAERIDPPEVLWRALRRPEDRSLVECGHFCPEPGDPRPACPSVLV